MENSKPKTGMLRRWTKRLTVLLGIVVALLVLVVLLLPIISPAFAPLVTSAIEDSTGRSAELEHLSINLLSSRASLRGLRIMEEDGTTRFAGVQNLEADFQLLPLLSSRIRIPSLHASGVNARVVVNKDGTANYQSILDHLSEEGDERGEGAEREGKTQPASLPDVVAHLQTRDVDITYADHRKDLSAKLTSPRLACTINGLGNISYESETGAIELDSEGPPKRRGSGKWIADGKAGIELQDGKLVATSEGNFQVDHVAFERGGETISRNKHFHATHTLTLRQGKKLQISTFNVDSDFLVARVSEFSIGDPAALPDLIGADSSRLQAAGLSDWTGRVEGEIRLRELANLLATLRVAPALEEANGTIRYRTSLDGRPPTTLRLEMKAESEELQFVVESPRSDSPAPVRMTFSSLNQDAALEVNLSSLATQGRQNFVLTGPSPDEELISAGQEWSTLPLLGDRPAELPLESVKSRLRLNLATFTSAVRGLLPEGMELGGEFVSEDEVTTGPEGELLTKGRTELSARFISPTIGAPLPLNIRGERQIKLRSPEGARLPAVDVEKFTLASTESGLLRLNASGRIAPSDEDAAAFRLDLSSDLGAAQQYLDLLKVPVKLGGRLHQNLEIGSRASMLRITGSGDLGDLSVECSATTDPLEVARASWRDDVEIVLREGGIRQIRLAPREDDAFQLRLPGIDASLQGAVNDIDMKQRSFRSDGLEISLQGDFKKFSNSRLARLLKRFRLRPAGNFSVGGTGTATMKVAGSFPGKLDGRLTADLAPLRMELREPGGQVLFRKQSGVPLTAEVPVAAQIGNKGWTLRVAEARGRLSDVAVSAGLSVDDRPALSGPGGGARFTLEADRIDGLVDMLPPATMLDPRDGDFRIVCERLRYGAQKGLHGKVTGAAQLKSLSLVEAPRLANLSRAMMERGPETEQPHPQGPEPDAETTQPVEIPPPIQELVKGLSGNFTVGIGTTHLGPDDQIRHMEMMMRLEGGKAADQLTASIEGKVNPSTEREGHINLDTVADLGQKSPAWRSEYEVQRFPLTTPVLETARTMTSFQTGMGVFDAVKFQAARELEFSAAGDARWKGIQWETMRRSLVSGGPISLDLPGGKFDLAVDPVSLLGSQSLRNLTRGRLEPLTDKIEEAREKKEQLSRRLEDIQNTVDRLQNTIDKIQEQKGRLKNTLEKLRPLATFSEDAEEKLTEWEKRIDEYAGDLDDKKEDLGEKKDTRGKLQEELDRIRGRLDEVKSKIEEVRTGKGIPGLEQILEFRFEGAGLEFQLDNQAPWPGQEDGADLVEYAISRIQLRNLEFRPKRTDFPGFRGWVDLAGDYRIRITPSARMLEDIRDNIPGLAKTLGEQGLVWSPAGVELPGWEGKKGQNQFRPNNN